LQLNPLLAYFATYAASVALHGLNFQLAAVLFTLAAFAFAEHAFRARLAQIFDASVEASPPRPSDEGHDHRYGEDHALVVAFNACASLLVCLNLAYLGVMFDQSHAMVRPTCTRVGVFIKLIPFQSEGYSWHHTLDKWSQLSFAPHLIMAVVFSLAKLV